MYQFHPENRGGPIFLSVSLASIIIGTFAVFNRLPVSMAAISFGVFIIPIFTMMLTLPGIVLAWAILKGYKKRPGFLFCLALGSFSGGLVTFLWYPSWGSIPDFPWVFFAGGPLAGTIHYFIIKQQKI